MSRSPQQLAADIQRTAVVLTGAFALGVVLFAGVATLLVSTGEPLRLIELDALGVQAVALAALAIGAPAGVLARGVLKGLPRDSVDDVRRAVVGETILAGALRESTGMIGALLILTQGALVLGLALVAVSAVLLVLGVPKADETAAAIRRVGARHSETGDG